MSKDFAISSREITSSNNVYVGACALSGVAILTDGTNNAVVILYDKESATGIANTNKLAEFTVIGNQNYGGRDWARPIRCANGIHANISGGGASCIIEYIPK